MKGKLTALDRDGDGYLDAEECGQRFNVPTDRLRREDLADTFMAFDTDGDGRLLRAEVPQRWWGIFERADSNRDGILTREEIIEHASLQPYEAAPDAEFMRRAGIAFGMPITNCT